ncbi:zinc-dependent alcohol dehydrogenase family protein [Actinomadura fibrosa]|uniref:Zinc-dependent alcohol dehydrogenase family protein n=1 Tax=Actinomadura fibrosa TaxID=111802 RepID=A0ABW2XV89_9ACTN|nr:zinc-dependent alcohol dehydrogenase family protein [Actinomadura fibrosa]
MRATVIHGPGDIRSESVPDPQIIKPTDAIISVAATCVCGSDLWSYRRVNPVKEPTPIGHEYVGVVTDIGSEVGSIEPGHFVIGSFYASDNSCPHCRHGYQSACVHREFVGGCQAEMVRVPLADGTLVPTPGQPGPDLLPSLLTLSDVMGTGWYAAVAAGVRPGCTVAVVGDGAVGLCGIIAARELGADRIIAMSRHEPRQRLAREYGATDVIIERGDDGVDRVMDLTGGVGADSVLECVGTAEAMSQALGSARPGGTVGFVGVPHEVEISGEALFRSQVGLRGGPAPVRRFLPDLIDRVWDGRIDPGGVFDLTLPLDQAAEAYRAMDERRAVKVLLRP